MTTAKINTRYKDTTNSFAVKEIEVEGVDKLDALHNLIHELYQYQGHTVLSGLDIVEKDASIAEKDAEIKRLEKLVPVVP